MSVVLFVVLLLLGAYVVAIIEGWVTTGRLEPAGPLASGLALVGRESIVPRQLDRTLFEMGPVLVLIAAVLAAAVLPLGPDSVVVNLATGALFVNAAFAYVAVALVMAGWGPNGAYGMVAGWRFLGQVIAYGMLIIMPIAAVGMRAQSLSMVDIVRSQDPVWNIVTQPVGFILFVLAAMALAFLPPFDLPIATELAGGVEGEYTGMRLAVFRLARFTLVLTLAGTISVFYLGGWLGVGLPAWLWSAVKTLAVAAALLLAGRSLARVREADMLAWAWKIGIPLALVNIAWVGIALLVVDG